MHRPLNFLLCAVAVAAVLQPVPADATTVVRLDLEAHIADSTAVVEAHVLDATQVVDAQMGRPFTLTRIRIDRVLVGEAPAELRIRQLKGVLEGQVHTIPGDGDLPADARVLLFVVHAPDGHWYLSALAQSVYLIHGEGDDATARRNLGGLLVLERDETGRFVPSKDADPRWTVGTLRAAVTAASSSKDR
jgi:hypothetical protein